jgi:DNA invertase Pin-like site-specific DNA recombinase
VSRTAVSVSCEAVLACGHTFGLFEGLDRWASVALQDDALSAAGRWKVWTDVASGARTDRPQLGLVLKALQPGNTLVVWRLDRLGRSLPHLIETVGELEGRGVGFRSLTESIDTTTPGGRLIFHIFGSLAQFERELVKERTTAGLAAARARGRTGGRPTVMTTAKVRAAQRIILDPHVRQATSRSPGRLT